MALSSSAEEPLAVRTVARALVQYVDRLGVVWVEGQVAQVSRRPGAGSAYFTLRDAQADMSLSFSVAPRVLAGLAVPLTEGQRVVVEAKAQFYAGRGTLTFQARSLRAVGLGELLAQLERLRALLAAEGLFAAERKRPLPFLPRVVGLVCGRGSAAEHDVVENARRRWAGVRFEIREVAVQGPRAVPEVGAAIRDLQALPEVDVIVVTRGGGSVEDLLPFSDEGLVRLVAACRTPVVSAIGHEQDAPLLDLVADVRASTPTDAARRVVPDVGEQLALVDALRDRADRAVRGRLEQETRRLAQLVERPVLETPGSWVDARDEHVRALRERSARSFAHRLERAGDDVAHTRARVRALSPLATLQRGYAVVQRGDGVVVRGPEDAPVGTALRIRVAGGELSATSD